MLVSAISFAALGLMTAVAVYALLERGHARESERAATARALSAQALVQFGVDQQRSLRLAVDAAELEATLQTEDVLRQALLTARQRRTLRTNGRPALVAYSPNGRLLMTVNKDGQASLWNPVTGRSLRRIRIDAPVVNAALAPSGNRILTAGANTVSVSRADPGRPFWTATRKAALEDAEFSDSGERVVTAWADRALLVKRSRDGKQLMGFQLGEVAKRALLSRNGRTVATIEEDSVGHLQAKLYRDGRLVRRLPELGVSDIAFNPDGSLLAVASRKNTTSVWRTSTGAPVWKRDDGGGPVVDATFSPNGEMLATASSDGGVRVWTVATGERTFFFLGHKNPVFHVAFDPSSSLLASASADHTVRLWQTLGVQAGLGVAILTGHRGAVTDLAFSANGRSLATVSDDGSARIWDVRIEQELELVGRMGGEVREALFGADGRSIVAVGSKGAALFPGGQRRPERPRLPSLSPYSGLGVNSIAGPGPRDVKDLDLSRDGTLLITIGNRAYSTDRDGNLIGTLAHGAAIVRAAFAPGGRLMLTAGGRNVHIWKALAATSRPRIAHVATLVQEGDITDAAFNADGHRIVTGSTDGALRIWDARTRALEHTLLGHRGPIVRVRWSPRGDAIVSAGTDATARLWSGTGVRLHTLRGHDKPLTDARFDPTGRRVVTTSLGSSANRNVIEWDARTGRRLHALVGHFHSVQTASFSPDGRWIVTAGPIAAAVWPADTGRLLFYLRGHSDLLTDAEWAPTPTGYRIVTAARDGTVRTYDCQVCRPLDGLIQVATTRLAGLEVRG